MVWWAVTLSLWRAESVSESLASTGGASTATSAKTRTAMPEAAPPGLVWRIARPLRGTGGSAHEDDCPGAAMSWTCGIMVAHGSGNVEQYGNGERP